jgi:hypothetical protein
MATQVSPLIRLLEQEREVLSSLVELAQCQENAMIAADVAAIEEVVARESALLQRESRISAHLGQLVRSGNGMSALLETLSEGERNYAQSLRDELAGLAHGLNRISYRLKALAESGLNRVSFIYQAVARSGQAPAPYQAPGRKARMTGHAMINHRV